MKISKENVWDAQTGISTLTDERVFSDCVRYQLQVVRDHAKELILAVAPEYKQRNAALGLLDQTETDAIKQAIQDIRAISNSKEAEILAVVWDGTEASRPAACDAVQAVFW
jgi:hypothetical protein